ncbi:MAG: LptF/LptG family permease [Phycisphaerae bacterium]|nr:LptF/LptG family permease [Phycisphaerae bacterium]
MTLLDRHIAARFFANFVLLFSTLFIFGVAIDVIVQLDPFREAVERQGTHGVAAVFTFIHAIFDFYGPRVFQFYAYLLGLVSVGAAGFTLAQMVRSRELVAIMAGGASLVRVGMVILACATGLNLLQLLNQELILPRLAPYLVRDHDQILSGTLDEFTVPLTRDGRGQLLRAQKLNPNENTIRGFLLIERDGKGAAVARTEADVARWNAGRSVYELTNGTRFLRVAGDGTGPGGKGIEDVAPIAFVTTDLSPEALKIRRYEAYAQMLSLRQLREMRETGGVDPRLLSRLTYLRLASIAVNLLVLVVTLPFFLLREPANMLRQSILCAAFAVPAALGSFVAMTIDMPGLAPAVSVFLPAAVLLPLALGRVGAIKT